MVFFGKSVVRNPLLHNGFREDRFLRNRFWGVVSAELIFFRKTFFGEAFLENSFLESSFWEKRGDGMGKSKTFEMGMICGRLICV